MAKHVANPRCFSNSGLRLPPCGAEPDEALGPLLAPVRTLRGVGPSLAATLSRLVGAPEGAEPRCLDLLWHLPHGVVERRLQTDATALVEGERVTLLVQVQQHQAGPPPRQSRRPGGRPPYKVRCWSESGFLHLVFFQARGAYLRDLLPEGEDRVVSGRLARFGAEWQIVHPELIAPPERFARLGPLQSLYPLTQGLSQRRLGRCIADSLARLQPLPEWQDAAWLKRQQWPSFQGALQCLHAPQQPADVGIDSAARRRLAYDELLAGQLALGLIRARED
ncbi:MAG: hypothetical protein ACREJ5_17945, partial [Geminicoccaceae bacterium]